MDIKIEHQTPTEEHVLLAVIMCSGKEYIGIWNGESLKTAYELVTLRQFDERRGALMQRWMLSPIMHAKEGCTLSHVVPTAVAYASDMRAGEKLFREFVRGALAEVSGTLAGRPAIIAP